MLTDIAYVGSHYVDDVDVNRTRQEINENETIGECVSDSGMETGDSCSATFPVSTEFDISSCNQIEHSNKVNFIKIPTDNESSSISTPDSVTSEDSAAIDHLLTLEGFPISNKTFVELKGSDDAKNICAQNSKSQSDHHIDVVVADSTYPNTDLKNSNARNLTTSSVSLDEQQASLHVICNSPFSRSAENISIYDHIKQKCELKSSDKELNAEKILSDFSSQKQKVCAVQHIPETTVSNSDARQTRLPKDLLSQDIGNIVKNVHGIFSSVSGSLKSAYSYRAVQKPVKTVKPIPNGKVMQDIFEDGDTIVKNYSNGELAEITNESLSNKEQDNVSAVSSENNSKKDVLRLQIEALERVLAEQRMENSSLRDKMKQQVDEMQQKEETCKELEGKIDLMSKRVDQAEREKEAAVMRYASVECAAIEAKKAAEQASRAEKAALNEVELLNTKLKSAHGEKHRICQLYDDKCHELMNSERELSKVREDCKEIEGRLKWTQSKFRLEMDAYKESTERIEKLSQQITELEAARDAAAANVTDSTRAKIIEASVKESQAALILCRHENGELEKRLALVTAQLHATTSERDANIDALALATAEVRSLREARARLEEEAAELAGLRARAALADSLAAQLHRESERATQAEEELSASRAAAETCARREAAALEHAARLSAHHAASRAHAHRHEAAAQALTADNVSLRERVATLEEENARLTAALEQETQRRNCENKVLARKVAELTEEVADVSKKLEWEKGENGVLKKKHSSAIKELNRELQRTLKRCEQLEAKLTPSEEHSTRTGSVTSLSSGESATQGGQADTLPDIQSPSPSPDRATLIERIVSLQRAAARRSERCEFLEEHARQLTGELRRKSRLLAHLLAAAPRAALASPRADTHKKEIARLGGGAMAALWGGDRGGITLDLSLEMNSRLQALLEDTLLKNITLKENIDTLGAEISRLKEQKTSSSNDVK